MIVAIPEPGGRSMRISQYLADQQVPFEALPHPLAFTAQRRAKYLGVPGRLVAKTVLLKGPAGYLVAILAAPDQVDTDKLASLLGGPVRLAQREEVAQVFGDCEWGVAAPFGSHYGLPVYLDEALTSHPSIVLQLQSHFEAIRLRSQDFTRLEQPRCLALARR